MLRVVVEECAATRGTLTADTAGGDCDVASGTELGDVGREDAETTATVDSGVVSGCGVGLGGSETAAVAVTGFATMTAARVVVVVDIVFAAAAAFCCDSGDAMTVATAVAVAGDCVGIGVSLGTVNAKCSERPCD